LYPPVAHARQVVRTASDPIRPIRPITKTEMVERDPDLPGKSGHTPLRHHQGGARSTGRPILLSPGFVARAAIW
jgi:hypothetical protein